MFDTYMGVIQALGFKFVPENWGYCAGGLMAIAQYSALYSLLSTFYGGNGQSSFALPNLMGRLAMGVGQSPGGTLWDIGDTTGVEQGYLTISHIPAHTHTHTYAGETGGMSMQVASIAGKNMTPNDGDYLAAPASGTGLISNRAFISPADIPAGQTAPVGGVTGSGTFETFDNSKFTIENAGGQQMVNIMKPCLVVNFCICIDGLYPARS